MTRPKENPIPRSVYTRMGGVARASKFSATERSAFSMLGAVASGRNMAEARARRAEQFVDAAMRGLTVIRAAVAAGGRVGLFDFADDHGLPYKRFGQTFAAVHGMTWRAAHASARAA